MISLVRIQGGAVVMCNIVFVLFSLFARPLLVAALIVIIAVLIFVVIAVIIFYSALRKLVEDT